MLFLFRRTLAALICVTLECSQRYVDKSNRDGFPATFARADPALHGAFRIWRAKTPRKKIMPEDSLANRAVLVAFDASADLRTELSSRGARIISLPELELAPVQDSELVNEAIENLYGYDWLVFIKSHAVKFFLQRLSQLGHEISEIDSLRVCAVGEPTASALELARVHVDVISERGDPVGVIDALATYLGGPTELGRLNFLIPQAAIGQDYLKEHFAEVGARADVFATYQTVAAGDSILTRLRALILGGGVDCLVLANEAEVQVLASLFDSNDLRPLLRNLSIACLDEVTEKAAERFGLQTIIRPKQSSFTALAQTISDHFAP
jgi:uroporphyrinogen III methyltransferase/synthase